MKYVGWDWASQTHDVTVLDDTGAVLERWAFAHTEAGWAAPFTGCAATATPTTCR